MSPLNPWKLSGYKAGQNVVCKVVKDEPGGYAVIIPKDNLPGFLPTQALLRTGEEILAQFVCVHNHRILLSARFSNNVSKLSATPNVRWEEHLDEIDITGGQSAEEEGYSQSASLEQQSQTITPQQQVAAQQAAQAASQQQQATSQPQAAIPQQPAQGNVLVPPSTRPDDGMYKNYQSSSIKTLPAEPFSPPPPPPQPPQGAPPKTGGLNGSMPYSANSPPQQDVVPNRLISIPANQSIQLEQEAEAEAAFGVWASTPRKFHLKRATDLILPPIDKDSLNEFKIVDYDLEWLITDLEGGMRTGCVKAACESKLSRSAMLLYRGRAVGCIYGCKSMPDTQPTEQSLQNMLSDLEVPDTDVKIYDLPENVTLAMSALFLGYPVQRNDDYDARAYMDYICGWFESKGNTACLAITLPSNSATCLGYVYKGQFCGAFYVEDQQFRTDKEFVYDLLKNDPRANVEASILPPEMTSSAVRFGFSLSMAKKRVDGR
ncbi:hypothetical protein BH10CYA1_BH10CYA1_21720 [soil metagenome]